MFLAQTTAVKVFMEFTHTRADSFAGENRKGEER